MNELLLIAIEADKQRKKPEHKCAMDSTASDLQKAVAGIGQAVYALREDVNAAKDAAEKAANKRMPKPEKPKDYVMDVVRDDKGLIARIDVKAVV
jgi:outer membrane murein-binding lipoprotein Lpp